MIEKFGGNYRLNLKHGDSSLSLFFSLANFFRPTDPYPERISAPISHGPRAGKSVPVAFPTQLIERVSRLKHRSRSRESRDVVVTTA